MTLILKKVSAGYDSRNTILRGIDLEVRSGEIVALIGANGAGKSTMVRAISGLIELSAGEIWFDGRRIDSASSRERVASGIVQVPEGRQMFAEMTVRENLRMGGYVNRELKSEAAWSAKIDALCKRFELLEARLNEPAGNLSGGQQQIVAIARGLMASPKLLILDEPSLGLSPIMVAEIFSLIKQLQADGIAILLSEQNARQTLAIADRGYVIANGVVDTTGTGQELLQSDEIASRYLGGVAAGADSNNKTHNLVERFKAAMATASV
ncbi:MAG TPA: ABC transporter ATP-binding protein [Herbaspirillum sp.]|jgi:branched-chain amino acid transport system ATP-binding protein